MESHCVLCEEGIEYLYQYEFNESYRVAGLSLCRLGYSAGSFHYRFYGGQTGVGVGFYPSTSVSPVSIIPPFLYTHSFIYHPHYKIFFSQYFSFPCQYHSTIAPYSFIHLPPRLYNVFLPVLQFPLSVSFHHCSTLIHSSTAHTV